ncbi:MAG: SOS response-associated peptidase [Cyclonatronaceae bacterium]
MCGRYTLYSPKSELESHFGAAFKTDMEPAASYNIAPGAQQPVALYGKARQPGITLMKWGLVPPFADDASIGFKMINARSETLDQKPSFKKAFQRKRCLIPANGFYEWKKLEGSDRKLPFYIRLIHQELFAFAGLFERWESNKGEELFTFTIITTQANSLLQPLHERMPVIVDARHYDYWLNPLNEDKAGLVSLLRPYPTENMSVFRISPEVNKTSNNHKGLIEPVV